MLFWGRFMVNLKRIAAGAAMAGALSIFSLGLGAGVANADWGPGGGYGWGPGPGYGYGGGPGYGYGGGPGWSGAPGYGYGGGGACAWIPPFVAEWIPPVACGG
jgi:hypothetical protein